MTDLRALFGSNEPVDTSEAFTNRQCQRELFATALAEHLRHTTAPGFDRPTSKRRTPTPCPSTEWAA